MMIILESLDQFKLLYCNEHKWDRSFEAIENLKHLKNNIMYCIDNSIMYMSQSGITKKTKNFEGHRHYIEMHYYLDGQEKVDVADKSKLQASTPYSNKTDKEYFSGTGQTLELYKGQVIIFCNDKAYRFHGDNHVKKVIIKVTT